MKNKHTIHLLSRGMDTLEVEDLNDTESLTSLNIDYNDIVELPPLVLPSLKEFSCSGNGLKSFNSSLFQAPKLQSLNATDNELIRFRLDDNYKLLNHLFLKG